MVVIYLQIPENIKLSVARRALSNPDAAYPATPVDIALVQRKSSVQSVPSWVELMLDTPFFGPCGVHTHLKKCEATFFCTTCAQQPVGLCQHCICQHQGHQVIQIRRYVYCDVVRTTDIQPFVDTTGVQSYIINQAKVVFLNVRPQAKQGAAGDPDTCHTCARHLREGAAYCSLACKV
ncbi:PLATZ transcription factor-domain-containing protein, partial [Haematococcus lacustris]